MTHLLASDDLFEVDPPLRGKQLKKKLRLLIYEATATDPVLLDRVTAIYRWVQDVKPGSLIAKKLLSAFLLQFISDATVWLSLQSLNNHADRQEILQSMTPTERYWYEILFPRWLQGNDTKFHTWKQKIMAGEFLATDADIIQEIAQNIAHCEGDFLQRYIADLSMATDLVVSRHYEQPLCVQITRVRPEFVEEKYEKWKQTLHLWQIDRGLFISYNPSSEDYINQVVNLVLFNSDNLRSGHYLKYCF
jgi:hypothetical protein